MFSYNENKSDSSFYITILSDLKYNFQFLNYITEMMFRIKQSDCKKIYFIYGHELKDSGKMALAYFYNTIRFFLGDKALFLNKRLYALIEQRVIYADENKFEKIDIAEKLTSDLAQCYHFNNDKSVNQTVQLLVNFIVEKNLIFKDVKEFLVTTIGEIFSNAFNHSDENDVFFMYDIEQRDGKFYLVINITDYGKTITGNVQNYQQQNGIKVMDSKSCMWWAVQPGNTTRSGSGGYGLPTLVDYVGKVKGELLIFSGECLYALKGTIINIFDAKGYFFGTSVSMKIPLFDISKMILYDKEQNEIISINLDEL